MAVPGMDRVKAALVALLGAGEPRVDYFTTYRAKVMKQSADMTKVDLKPDDARIPQCSDVRIKWGIPGVKAKIAPGCYMHLGWENGDPSKRYAMIIEDGATQLEITIEAVNAIYMGDKGAAKELATKDHVHDGSTITAPSGGGACSGVTGVPQGVGALTTILKGA